MEQRSTPYWRECVRLAWRGLFALSKLAILPAVLGALGGVAIQWQVFGWDTAREQAILVVTGAVGGAALVVALLFMAHLLFVAPYQLYREARDLITELRDELREYQSAPLLEFGVPSYLPNEVVYLPSRFEGTFPETEVRVELWRISLKNSQPNSQASNVRVRLESTEPAIDLLPIDLHERHDNSPPYRVRRDMRHGESAEFDVIAKSTYGDELAIYIYRSDVADRYSQRLSGPAFGEIAGPLTADGVILTVKAFADPPARGAEKRFRAVVEGASVTAGRPTGSLVLRPYD